MDLLEKKSLQTRRGHTYTYYVSSKSDDYDETLPSLFFSHGWPDNARLYDGIVTELRKLPYRIVVPDLLGFDGTSKPEDPAEYACGLMSNDLIEIIGAEGIDKVISIGHDWGSFVAQRLYNFHPDRVVGLILLNVAYIPPAQKPFDLDAVNKMTAEAFGYPIYEYWHFFTSDEAPALLKDKASRVYEIMHAAPETAMRDYFCVPNAFRDYLVDNSKTLELREYAKDPKFREAFINRMKRDGFEGPQNYYKAMKDNVQSASDKQLPEGRAKVDVPVLYIGCTQDYVCRPEPLAQSQEAGLLPDLEMGPMLEAAHWAPYEKPDEYAKPIADFLTKRFPANK